MLLRFSGMLSGLMLILIIGGCAPEPGSREWCEMMDNKPKGEWTANEAGEYTQSCVF